MPPAGLPRGGLSSQPGPAARQTLRIVLKKVPQHSGDPDAIGGERFDGHAAQLRVGQMTDQVIEVADILHGCRGTARG